MKAALAKQCVRGKRGASEREKKRERDTESERERAKEVGWQEVQMNRDLYTTEIVLLIMNA